MDDKDDKDGHGFFNGVLADHGFRSSWDWFFNGSQAFDGITWILSSTAPGPRPGFFCPDCSEKQKRSIKYINDFEINFHEYF